MTGLPQMVSETASNNTFDERVAPTLEPRTCPDCGQMVKLYRRNIYQGMARQLVRLVFLCTEGRTDPEGFVHVRALSRPGEPYCDLGKLHVWAPSLVDAKLNVDTKKRCSGLWKPTAEGLHFVRGKLRVAKYVYIFNKTVHAVSSETVSISEALGEEFDYAAMMAAK